ncbi:MAG: LuxR C-terminal-related transcriptional regulator [Candidatus Promineifilaceae bacterium]|nr:LuxR C-terminal-related transcriptional regulator [Candidatus Promineifilaceae bacterium]
MESHNLPIQLTSLIGREQEIATLRQFLLRPEIRLVTITGPFGVGKTSLSLATGHTLVDSFRDGVFLVPLAPISDTTLIIPTIAQTLGVKESPRRLDIDNLKDHLQNRELLLLLDNFEQIITAAPLLSELLSTCFGLKLLVTSREPLRLRGEQVLQLPTLALPDQSTADNGLLHYPAIALFVERAREAKYDFELTDENKTAVAELCAQLDGLPLAIELAAARIRLLPPQTILAQLQTSHLKLLRGGARDLPDRHQTLRRAVRWSYDLLAVAEQRALRWLSVFVGGCTMEAALEVLGPDTSIDVLDSLVSKSLLRQKEASGAPRFTLLEAIREFGWEQLVNTAELQEARRTHAAWYTNLAEKAEPHLEGEHQNMWLQRFELEKDNLRAAYRWAIESGDGVLAMRLAAGLRLFWFLTGRWSEGRRSLEEVVALETDTTPDQALRARVLYQASLMAQYQSDFARARDLCEQSLTLYRTLDDRFGIVMTLVRLARISQYRQDHNSSKSYLAEAATLIESLPDSAAKARAYRDIYLTLYNSPGPITDQTIQYLTEAERIARKLKNHTDLIQALVLRALYHSIQGEMSLATAAAKESKQLSQQINSDYINTRAVGFDLYFDVHSEEFAMARQRLGEMIKSANQRNDFILPIFLTSLAGVLWKQKLPIWSAKVLGLANIPANNGQDNPNLVFTERFPAFSGFYENLRAELGEEAFAQTLAAGRQMTIADLDAIPHPSVATVRKIDALTPRELDVLQLLAQELSNPQIAGQLVVSRRTVDAHLRSIYDKLGVKSRDAAVRVAQERGLLS